MDFKVTVRTYTGAVKTVEVKNMSDEDAARAEAVAMTFGRVLEVTRTDTPTEDNKPKRKTGKLQPVEKELKPGETETIITGYNNNPLALFMSLDLY